MSNYQHERGWLDSPVWRNAPYSEREAWSWMIGEAVWKDTIVDSLGVPVSLKRGSFTASLRFMADKWQWKKDKVKRFLTRLEKWQMIEIETVNATGQTLVKVCNYNVYQEKKGKGATENATPPRQGRDTPATGARQTRNPSNPSNQYNRYWFTGEVIRLNEKDYKSWLKLFGDDDDSFMEWLTQRDDWLQNQSESKQRNWFISTPKAIEKLEAV